MNSFLELGKIKFHLKILLYQDFFPQYMYKNKVTLFTFPWGCYFCHINIINKWWFTKIKLLFSNYSFIHIKRILEDKSEACRKAGFQHQRRIQAVIGRLFHGGCMSHRVVDVDIRLEGCLNQRMSHGMRECRMWESWLHQLASQSVTNRPSARLHTAQPDSEHVFERRWKENEGCGGGRLNNLKA